MEQTKEIPSNGEVNDGTNDAKDLNPNPPDEVREVGISVGSNVLLLRLLLAHRSKRSLSTCFRESARTNHTYASNSVFVIVIVVIYRTSGSVEGPLNSVVGITLAHWEHKFFGRGGIVV